MADRKSWRHDRLFMKAGARQSRRQADHDYEDFSNANELDHYNASPSRPYGTRLSEGFRMLKNWS